MDFLWIVVIMLLLSTVALHYNDEKTTVCDINHARGSCTTHTHLYIKYLMNFLWSEFTTRTLTSTDLLTLWRQFFFYLDTGTETSLVDNVFPLDDLWFHCSIKIMPRILQLYIICIKCLTDWECSYIICLTGRGRDVIWWPGLSGHWLSCTGCGHYLSSYCIIDIWDTVSRFIHLPSVSVHGYFFQLIGQLTTDLLYVTIWGKARWWPRGLCWC